MRTRMIFAVLATMFVASTALANELPPFSGSHDDASYGDMTHSTFATTGLPGGSALAAGPARQRPEARAGADGLQLPAVMTLAMQALGCRPGGSVTTPAQRRSE